MSTITLNTKSYVGNGILNGISQFWERAAGIVSGFSSLTNRINFGATKTTVAWKLVVPIVQGEATACACPGDVLRDTIVDITVRYDRRALAAERGDVLLRIQDLVQSPEFEGSVSSLAQAS